jgi:hypothetical protein
MTMMNDAAFLSSRQGAQLTGSRNLVRTNLSDGRVLEGICDDRGRIDGPQIIWRADRSVASLGWYAKGVPNGPFHLWHPNGAMKAWFHSLGGFFEGTDLQYAPDGDVAAVRSFRSGMPDGIWRVRINGRFQDIDAGAITAEVARNFESG